MNMLTPKQWRSRAVEVLTLIDRSLDHRGYPPTLVELGKDLGLSKATVHETLSRMQREKLINWDSHMARTLWTTEKGVELLEEALHVQ